MIATNRKQLDNISYLTNAKVGIFWFLPATGTLFECHVQAVSDSNSVQNLITFPKLHKTIWTKKYYRDKSLGKIGSIYYQDYTQIPRGRIFYDLEENRFVVMVGSWYRTYESMLAKLIKQKFGLSAFEFRIGEHWELGNGRDENRYSAYYRSK